jgi:hypothetical protein
MSKLKPENASDDYGTEESARRYEATLKSVLSAPPQPKPKKANDASPPKKRGRPVKSKTSGPL